MVCLVWSVVALSHRQFCWAGGVGVCQLPALGSVSGQAGLHGNVLQSCCLLAAFCCSTCQADAETTETTTAAGYCSSCPAPAQLFAQHTALFPHFGGTVGIPLPKDRRDKGSCDVPSCSLLAFVLVFLADCHFSQEHC